MNVCVVGCTGYLGSSISASLKNKGHNIIGIARKFSKENKEFSKIFKKIYYGDLTNFNFLEKIFFNKIDAIIYTASLNHKTSEKNIQVSINNNYLPLVSLCELLKNKKKKIKFIYFSTMQVYGNYSKIPLIKESCTKKLNNIYALTHSLCEDTLATMKKKNSFFDSISLRLSNGYGYPILKSCDCWWLVMNDFCLNAIKKKKIIINSDGSATRDLLHTKDICSAVLKILNYKAALPDVINLASGKTYNILELAFLIKKFLLKKKIKIEIFLQNKILTDLDCRKKIEFFQKKKFEISIVQMKNLFYSPVITIKKGIENFYKNIS